MSSDRDAQIIEFLSAAGWGDARRDALPGDASTRRYEKLNLDGQNAILMDAAPIAQTGTASGKSYAQIAKLADGQMVAFTAIDEALTRRGFSAPKILAADLSAGFLLLEDLGNDLVAHVLEQKPGLEREIYLAAMDTLGAIYRSSFNPEQNSFGQDWHIRSYDNQAMQAEVDLMLEWYFPHKNIKLTAVQKTQWESIWARAFKHLDAHAPGLVLRDFHAENIFWLPERTATSNIGLIDFQDALMGHPAYDAVSLIEDARRDVDTAMTEDLIERFCAAAKLKNDDKFRAAYAVMGAQRNAKILGIFVRLAKRDGKQTYLDLMPRVQAHFDCNLSHPALAQIKDFIGALT